MSPLLCLELFPNSCTSSSADLSLLPSRFIITCSMNYLYVSIMQMNNRSSNWVDSFHLGHGCSIGVDWRLFGLNSCEKPQISIRLTHYASDVGTRAVLTGLFQILGAFIWACSVQLGYVRVSMLVPSWTHFLPSWAPYVHFERGCANSRVPHYTSFGCARADLSTWCTHS